MVVTLHNLFIYLFLCVCVQGEEIFQALLNKGLEKKVSIRIAQDFPSQSESPLDTEILAKSGAAEVYSLLLFYLLWSSTKILFSDFNKL